MFDLVFLLTAGFDLKTGIPTKNGLKRVEKAISLITESQVKVVSIIGGLRLSGLGEADLYMQYITLHYPEVVDRVVWIVDSSATCTPRDLLGCLPKVDPAIKPFGRAYAKVGIISYEEHMERANITLYSLGFRKTYYCNSGETRIMSKTMESILNILTWIDPGWKWFPPCLFLVWLANRRLKLTLIELP